LVASQFAHQHNGVFFLRIEDTDQKRLIENGIDIIINGLNRFGIKFDE
jgi:glutamyl-tRNA synthetase